MVSRPTWTLSALIENFGAVWIQCLLVALVFGPLGTPVSAQQKLEVGEQIKVNFLNEWRDGVILGKEKARYGVEFEFAGVAKQQLFERAELRKLCEFEALDFSRTWKSESGKFQVDAALKSFEGDSVVLTKVDLSEVTVPLASLSKADVAYCEKLRKKAENAITVGAIPAPTPTLPEPVEFSAGIQTIAAIAVGEGQVEPLGTLPSHLQTFTESGTGFKFSRERQELISALPVGGPEQLVLMATREDNFFNQGVKFQSQVYWVSLKQRKVLGFAALTSEHYIVDYHPEKELLLSIYWPSQGHQDSATLVLWRLPAAATAAEPLISWKSKIDESFGDIFAKIIDERTVLAKVASQTYVCWDWEAQKELYRWKSGSFFDSKVVLTPDRKHLIAPEDGKVTVIKTDTGDLKFSLSVNARHTAGANISPDGRRLAALTESQVFVWDLTQSKPQPQAYAAPLIGSPFDSRIDWVDDDLILAESSQGRVLYRLSLQLPVWSYRLDDGADRASANPLKSHLLNGLFFYVANPDHSGSVAVGAVKLPGPQVEEVTKSIDKTQLDLVKRGSRIALNLKNVESPDEVRRWLEEKFTANGWELDAASPFVMTAEMGRGAPRSETYRSFGLGRDEVTVNFQPYFATLVLKNGDLVVWQSGSSTGAPPVVMGSDIQAQVSSQQVPQTEFFRNVKIPESIIDPKFSRGFGISSLGLRGLTVVSTTPPGRENDPNQAPEAPAKDREQEIR